MLQTRSLYSTTNNPWYVVVFAIVAYLCFLYTLVGKHNFDLTRLITAGINFVNKNELPHPIAVLPFSDGYDGQFYYRLSLDPFTSSQADFGIRLDNPAYRQQRILYPLIVYVLSAGNASVVPFLLVLVNTVGIGVIAYFGALYSSNQNKHAFWGLTFPLYTGFLFTYARDLTEIIAASLLLAGIVYYQRHRWFLSCLFFTGALLAKETTLPVILAILFLNLLPPKKDIIRPSAICAGIPPLISIIWHVWLTIKWGNIWSVELRNNIGVLLGGVSEFIRSIPLLPSHVQQVYIAELIFLAVFVFSVIFALRSSFASLFIKLSWIIYLVMMISLTNKVWVEDFAYMRAFSETYILGCLILLSSKSKVANYVLIGGVVLWAYIFFDFVRYR